MTTYFSTFIPGLGEIVQKQLAETLKDFGCDLLLDGFVQYQTTSSLNEIKRLRFLNNSFILLKSYQKLGDNPLEEITKFLLQDFPVSPIPKNQSFRIMCYLANEPTKLNKILLKKLEEKISEQYKLTVNRTAPDLEFWVYFREEGYGFFGLRITKHPDYKDILAKGQLRPELANILCLISEPNKSDIVLDPFAGSGAIAVERKHFPYTEILSGDIDPNNKSVIMLDALNLGQITSGSVDKIITDPPWGISVGKELDLRDFYHKMLSELYRVLNHGGLLVLLIGKKALFENVLEDFGHQFSLKEKYDILVSGKKAAVYKLIKTP